MTDDLLQRLRNAERDPYRYVRYPDERQSLAGDAVQEIIRLRTRAESAERERDALRERIATSPVYEMPDRKPTTSEGWLPVIEAAKLIKWMRGKRVRLVVEGGGK